MNQFLLESSYSPTPKKKYIAFLDILGFKALIENNSYEYVIQYYKSFYQDIQLTLSNFSVFEHTNGQISPDVDQIQVNSILMSDSLFLWVEEDNHQGFIKLVNSVQRLLEFCHNKPKFRFLRGCITYDEFYYLNNGIRYSENGSVQKHDLLFGKAVLNVTENEKRLEMIGVIIDKNSIKQAKDSCTDESFDELWEFLIQRNRVLKYDVPFKKNTNEIETQSLFTICWVEEHSHTKSSEIESGFGEDNKPVLPNLNNKIKHTLEYFKFSKNRINPNWQIEDLKIEDDTAIKAYYVKNVRKG